ncbi:MAG TPA: hypothetical protein VNY05_17495 [Candidatus Acidoferrales bacterium]|nr:hypothetical protein [Candidatus Acidoferrales bacterium]
MVYYERNLPYWHPEGAAIFLTWRLHGTAAHFRAEQEAKNAGRAFVAVDRQLAATESGPKWLREPAIAQCVVDALRFGERQLKLYTLVAYCVMPNHVHLVVDPECRLRKSRSH